jgi:methyl-accepting chemotaxis protein
MEIRRRDWCRGLRKSLPYVLRFSALWIVVSVAAVLTAGLLGLAVIIEGPPLVQQGRLMLILGLQTLSVIVALLILAVVTASRLAEPWIAIRRALREVRDGDFDRRLSFRSSDKHLQDLEVAFNEMMTAVRSRTDREEEDEG